MKTNLTKLVLIGCCLLILSGCAQSDKSEQPVTDTATANNSSLDESTNNGESQYIGQWDVDQFKGKITINSDGTFIIKSYEFDFEGRGTWISTPETITFRKVQGDMFPWKSAEEITFKYYDIFAPVIALDGPDGHVDISFSNHK